MTTARMKSSLPGPFLLLFLSGPVSGLGSVLVKGFTLIQDHYSWQDAQTFCRSSADYTDLALIHDQADADSLWLQQYVAWIDGQLSPYFYWSGPYGQYYSPWTGPGPNSGDGCVYVSFPDKRFYGADCRGYYFSICYTFDNGDYKYTFINQSKTWAEARHDCKTTHSDLAVIRDFDQLYSAARWQDFPVWTGLYRDGGTWRWSAGASDYRSWAPNQPGNDGDCVAVTSGSKRMITQSCSSRFPSVCFRDNLLLVKQNKTWEEALEHCRAFRSPSGGPYQLVSLQPGDLSYMMARATEADTEEVWTGLRFLAGDWLWMNGADMLLSELPLCPLDGHNCGALSRSDTGRLQPRDCSEERNFLCYSQG